MKVVQGELASKYIDRMTTWDEYNFTEYYELLQLKHKAIPKAWKELPEDVDLKYLYFDFGSINVFAHCDDKPTEELAAICDRGGVVVLPAQCGVLSFR